MNQSDIDSVLGTLTEGYPFIVFSAPTGTGKSTRIPTALTQDGLRTFVGVPTVTAARMLADYVRTQYKMEVGVGAEGVAEYTDDTLLVYMTHGHMLNLLIRGFRDGQCRKPPDIDVLMVDEAHTGTLEITQILGLWSLCAIQNDNEPPFPMILSSATLSAMDLSTVQEWKPVILEIPESRVQRFSVQVRFTQKTFAVDSPELYRATAQEVNRYDNRISGNILVFVPGQAEAEMIRRQLRVEKHTPVIISASLGSRELRRILNSTEPHIFLTTNVAEDSITVPAEMAIDTLMEKIRRTTPSGSERLETVRISASSAQQRRGRVGRLKDGIYLAMTTEEDFRTLAPLRQEEAERVSISREMMSLLQAGIDPIDVLISVDEDKINATEDLLREQGLIDDNGVTQAGELAAKVPLGVLPGKVLFEWIKKGLPVFPGIVSTVLIDTYGPNFFFFPRREARENEFSYAGRIQPIKEGLQEFGGPDPMRAYLGMAVSLLTEFGDLEPRYELLNTFAVDKSLNAKKIREFFVILLKTTRVVERFLNDQSDQSGQSKQSEQLPIGVFNPDNVFKELQPILRRVYANFEFTQKRQEIFSHPTLGEYRVTGTGAWNEEEYPKKILALNLLETGTGKRVRKTISLYTAASAERINTATSLLDEFDLEFGLV